jgi:hypothetical protein
MPAGRLRGGVGTVGAAFTPLDEDDARGDVAPRDTGQTSVSSLTWPCSWRTKPRPACTRNPSWHALQQQAKAAERPTDVPGQKPIQEDEDERKGENVERDDKGILHDA